MRPRDLIRSQELDLLVRSVHENVRQLPGVTDAIARRVFIEQLLESSRRVRVVEAFRQRDLSEQRANPNSSLFDPVKAAIFHQRNGNTDEAFWLVFLFVHFGKHLRGGWRYAKDIYGRLGANELWNWTHVSADPVGFRNWLHDHQEQLKREGPHGFGNHRKYESLDALSENGTGAVVESYVQWVAPPRTHLALIQQVCADDIADRRLAFRRLYPSMSSVRRFGRTARLDYLAMLGKLGLANIEPDSPYIVGATGPLRGARLLFGPGANARQLDSWTVELGNSLGLGMQIMEDALCNWQKSPQAFVAFRG